MKKKTVIIIAATLCVFAIGLSIVLLGNANTDVDAFGNLGLDNGEYISRATWIAQLGQCFTLNTYKQTVPYYSDIPSNHDVFEFVQSCYEWGILRDKDTFRPDETATRAFVAETAMLAAGLERDTAMADLDANSLLQLACREGILAQSTAYGVTEVECAQIIQKLEEYYLGYVPEEYANIALKNDVVDYSSAEITWKDDSVLVVPEDIAATLTVGTVFLVSGDSSATAREVVSVKSVNGHTEVETVAPEVEEVFEDLSFSFTGTPALEDIVPLQEGITIHPLEDITPVNSNTTDAKIVKLSSAVPLAAGSKDDPVSFGVKINLTKGSLTPSIGFADYFSLEAEQAQKKFFGKVFNENAEVPKEDQPALEAGELFKQTRTILRYDKDGNLILDKPEKWTKGYEITGELKVSDLYVEAACKSNGNNPLESFTCELHYTIESSLSYKGKLEGSVPAYETVIPGPYGIWVKVIFSVYVDINGEIAVSAEIDHTTNVTYLDQKFKSVQNTDYQTEQSIGADIDAGIKGEVVLTVLGIDLIDVSAKAGAQMEIDADAHQDGNASMLCIEANCHYPKVSISIGGNTKTVANKLGIKLTLKLIDKSGALAKSASRTVWHYEVTAEGVGNVKECTWDTYSAEANNGTSSPGTTPPTTIPATSNNSALIGRWVLYAGGTEIGNGLWMDRHIFTIELMEDGLASVSSGIMYSEYYSGWQGTWQAFAKSNNCFEIRFDMKGGNIIPGQDFPPQERSMTIEATVENNTMRVKKLSGDDIDGVYSEIYTKESNNVTPPTTEPPATVPPVTQPPANNPPATNPPVDNIGACVTFDFSTLNEDGVEITEDEALGLFNSVASGDGLTAVTVYQIYNGPAGGSAFKNSTGFLMCNAQRIPGDLIMTFNKNVTKVDILCHDVYTKDEHYPTNENQISINGGAAQMAPYSEEGVPAILTFDLDGSSNIVDFDFTNIKAGKTGRVLIFKVVVYFAPETQPPVITPPVTEPEKKTRTVYLLQKWGNTTYTYDNNGFLTSVSGASNIDVDNSGQLLAVHDPWESKYFTYNENGRVVKARWSGEFFDTDTEYFYDTSGNITKEHFSEVYSTSGREFIRDSSGKAIAINILRDGKETTKGEIKRDAQGRISEIVWSHLEEQGEDSGSTTYMYSSDGSKITVYYKDGTCEILEFDHQGHLIRVGETMVSYTAIEVPLDSKVDAYSNYLVETELRSYYIGLD